MHSSAASGTARAARSAGKAWRQRAGRSGWTCPTRTALGTMRCSPAPCSTPWPHPHDRHDSGGPITAMSPSDLSLQRVVSDADRRAFLSFPHQLYREDPNWIPRLWPEQMDWLCRRNPFFEQGDGDWFIARRNDQVVGTIGVATDHNANRVQGRKWGIFGFLEFVEDEQVFQGLVERAKEYLRLRGATHMVGPRSFGESDFPGLLVGRYDCPAALMEGHTP